MFASRPIYTTCQKSPFWQSTEIKFGWYPGFALAQAQRSIESLHAAASSMGLSGQILEISTKSVSELGRNLSALNLMLSLGRNFYAVERVYQASKVFERGGPFVKLLDVHNPKRDGRLRGSGNLLAFCLDGKHYPLDPVNAFYTWIYLRALRENSILADRLLNYNAFTDITFNPKRSVNCQAMSAAFFASLRLQGVSWEDLADFNFVASKLGDSSNCERITPSAAQLDLLEKGQSS